jgi:glucarate dehydratase
MRITDVETTIVSVPHLAPLRNSQGATPGTTRTIIRIYSDENIVGLGETVGSAPKNVIDKNLRQIVVGSNPFDIEKLLAKCSGYDRYQPFFSRNMRAFSGIEIALWDMIGKSIGKPVFDLLGGKYRDRVSFSGYWYPRYKLGTRGGESTPEQIAHYCGDAIKKYGFTRLEGKVGVFSPTVDIETVAAIRSQVGEEIEIGVDANGLWSPESAIRIIKKMDQYDLCNVEEPCRDLEASARVRSRVDVPISTHCPLIAELVRLGVADVMVCDPYEVGGILATKKLCAACELHNLGFWIHSAAELGISMAANLHIAASSPHIIHPSQGTYEHVSDEIIKGGKFKIRKGCIEVPEGPGLGVEIDEAKLRTYEKMYQEKGDIGFAGYGTISSDFLRPDWWPSMPQW